MLYCFSTKRSRAFARSHPRIPFLTGRYGLSPFRRENQVCDAGSFLPAFIHHFESVWRCLPIATKELQINEQIRDSEVRLIGSDGEQLGVVPTREAQRLADEKELDLVKIAPTATPPVCRIMDYGKYRFERDKKEKEAKKRQTVVEVKEIQLSCRIDTHDFETKVKHAHRFIGDGNKVRVVVKFKGREMSHLEIGRDILAKFEEACSDVGTVDKRPALEGRFMSMVISPAKQPAK